MKKSNICGRLLRFVLLKEEQLKLFSQVSVLEILVLLSKPNQKICLISIWSETVQFLGNVVLFEYYYYILKCAAVYLHTRFLSVIYGAC